MKYEDVETLAVSAFDEQRKRITAKTQETNTKWTYIMYDYESKMCKIGISNNPYKREKEMKPFRPKAALFLLHRDNKEKELHERFSDKHYSGEWFELSEEDMVGLIIEDGFRYAPGMFGDEFDANQLYVVNRDELRKNKQSRNHFSCHPEYWDFINLSKELNGCKTATVREANKRGMRTPSGFPWKIGFATHVFRLYEHYLKGEID